MYLANGGINFERFPQWFVAFSWILGWYSCSGSPGVWELLRGSTTRPPHALVFDTYRLYRAAPLLASPPSNLHLLIFLYDSQGVEENATEVRSGEELTNWLNGAESNKEPRGLRSAGFQAIASTLKYIPYDSTVFLFTSRPPRERNLAERVTRLLIAKRVKLNFVWTGQPDAGSMAEYEEVSRKTGGTVVTSREAKSSQIVNGQSQLEHVTLAVKRGVTGKHRIQIRVDSTIKKLDLILTGSFAESTLLSPKGERVKLKEEETTVNVQEDEIGLWTLDTDGNKYDIIVEALADITFTSFANVTNRLTTKASKSEGSSIRRIEELNLLDENGNKIAKMNVGDEGLGLLSSQIELYSDLTKRSRFVQVSGENNNGEKFERVSYISKYELPTSIEVSAKSTLTVEKGSEAEIIFEVTNNLQYSVGYNFLVRDTNNYVRRVTPSFSLQVPPRVRIEVIVLLLVPREGNPSRDKISLTAATPNGMVTKSAYLHIGQRASDSSTPDISYTYSGDCSDYLRPDKCSLKSWGVKLTIVDTDSGLLKIRSRPGILKLENEFIVGTRGEVKAEYTASCCSTKLEVDATNTEGGTNSKVIDVEKKWLSTGEISAIVLGAALFIILLIIIIICIVVFVKKRQTENYFVTR